THPSPTHPHPLSLHDALPIWSVQLITLKHSPVAVGRHTGKNQHKLPESLSVCDLVWACRLFDRFLGRCLTDCLTAFSTACPPVRATALSHASSGTLAAARRATTRPWIRLGGFRGTAGMVIRACGRRNGYHRIRDSAFRPRHPRRARLRPHRSRSL